MFAQHRFSLNIARDMSKSFPLLTPLLILLLNERVVECIEPKQVVPFVVVLSVIPIAVKGGLVVSKEEIESFNCR